MSPRFAVPVVLALGVSLSLLLFSAAREVEESRMRDRFERAASNRVAALRGAVERAVEDVEALAALFDAAGEVDRAQFRRFAARLLEHGHGAQALEWIPRVPHPARARFEEAARRDGYASFQFTDRRAQGVMVRAAPRPEYYPVYYVEPYAGNETALGFDIASDATRREALERSAGSGEMTATAPIILVQETARQAGVLLSFPVYRTSPGEPAASRRDRLAGFVLGVYRIGQLTEGAFGRLAPDGVDVHLLDDAAPPGETLLHVHCACKRCAPCPASPGALSGGLHHTASLRVADRTWRVVCAPAPELLAAGRTWHPWALLSANLAVTGLLAGYLLLVLNRARRARAHAAELLRAKEALEAEIAERRRAEEARDAIGQAANRNLSARERAEAGLRASQERLHKILETANEGICVIDAEGGTEFANGRFLEILGLCDVVGRLFLELIPPAAKPIAAADIEAARRGETIHREFTHRRPDGSDVRVLLSMSALRAADGAFAGAVYVFTDITARRRTEEQLLQSQKMEAVGQLASGVAHDFNNLLAVIKSSAQFLRDDLPEGDPRRDAEEILQAGERAVQLTRRLLAFGRKSPANPALVDVSAAVQGVEKLLRRMVGEDVALSASLEAGPWRTRVDPGHLDQVLMNLVVNARDAMPDGGEIRIETRSFACDEPPRGCESLSPGNYVVLSVADTGCGIAPELLPKIFEPFFTTKEPGKGTGLGLATVYGIVEQAGGKIAVSSQVGRGTTFTVYLPARDAADSERREPAATRAEMRREWGCVRTVLLVEDDDPLRRVTRRMLERRGFEVKEAPDAVEAFRQLRGRESPVDLVLSDVVMPEVKGTDLAVVLRELCPEIPVVLMSGYSDRREVWEGKILRKPFTEDALLVRIEEELQTPPPVAAGGGSQELRS